MEAWDFQRACSVNREATHTLVLLNLPIPIITAHITRESGFLGDLALDLGLGILT